MKKFVCAFVIAGLIGLFPTLAGSSGPCPGIDLPMRPLRYNQVAVSSTAVTLGTMPTTATRIAIVMVEVNPIRFRDDGVDPTASVGTLVQPDNAIIICGPAITAFKAIRTGSDASISVALYGDQ